MNHPRRVRSPPFGYNPRAMNMVDGRPQPPAGPDYDDPYAQGPPFEPPAPAFMEPQYPGYRDHRLPSTYRATMREPYPSNGPASYKILCITNINPKVGDGPVKDALTNDFSRFGDISVSICHDSGERLAYIYFRTYEEAREARHAKSRSILFDRPIEIEPIFDPRVSPVDSPPPHQQPQMCPRRRSITPPEVYYDMNGPVAQDVQRPSTVPSPLSHHQGMTPTNYPHTSRYPIGAGPSSPMAPGPPPYSRYHVPTSHLGPPVSPYSSPPRDPHFRSSHPHPDSFMPTSYPPYHQPPYAPPPIARERERMMHESPRIPRHDPYYPVEHNRGYQPPQSMPPHMHSTRGVYSNSSHHHHHHHHPSMPSHVHQSSSSTYNSPPYPEAPRYASRDVPSFARREKFEGYNSSSHDESRPSRVLIVNNIDATKTDLEVRDIFMPFGIIEDVEVSKIGGDISSALIKFSSMDAAYKAKTATNGRYIGSLRCRIIYGKVNASRRLWIGGMNPSSTFAGLEDEVSKYGEIVNLDYTSGRPYAYVEYESTNQAQFAAHHLRGTLIAAPERKIRIEFVDTDRAEKSAPRHDSSLQVSEVSSRSTKTTNESWSTNEQDPSPQPVNRKRSITPNDSNNTKRTCTGNDPAQSSNNFRLDLGSASTNLALLNKARSSSNAPSEDNKSMVEAGELNNNQNVESQDDENATGSNGPVDNIAQAEIDNLEDPNRRLIECTTIDSIIQYCPVYWSGHLLLRNFDFPSKLVMFRGNQSTIEKYLTSSKASNGENGGQDEIMLRITQRWRLHPQPKLEEVKRRMQTGNLGMLIITSKSDYQSPILVSPSSSGQQINGESLNCGNRNASSEESKSATSGVDAIGAGGEGDIGSGASQIRPLKNLISYLEQKDAAGVISLQDRGDGPKLLYAFPPGDFALNLLKRQAPKLVDEMAKEEFLLGVIVGGAEGKM